MTRTTHVLSDQVAKYHDWKSHLVEQIDSYLAWLQNNGLNSEDVEARLSRGLELLANDQLTIAMIGEYSRGKTELINALLFSEFGQRMLPSQAGRTTMCPTEIFYDSERTECYLKLLPIETRKQNTSISQLKKDETAWNEVLIDTSKPEQLSKILLQVAATRMVPLEEAYAYGFDESMLEYSPADRTKVIIPLWRHALLSLDNPLLKQGLRILDTPGLNALGSEPELTISMVPKAQALIFLLSADAGVTASDLAIWKRFVDVKEADHRAGRFAILNKIDVLWDDLQGDTHVTDSIEKVKQDTANHLGLDVDAVIPLSAKQGLIGHINHDQQLLKRSALPQLEKLISGQILAQKEKLIFDDLIDDVSQMLHSSQAVLNENLANLYDQYDALENEASTKEVLQSLAAKTHQDHDLYYKKLITLKSSRRLMRSQGEILSQLMGELRFKAILKQTKRDLDDSWSTVGLTLTMNKFFSRIEKELDNITMEAKLADKMVSAIYQRFKSDINAKHLQPRTFNIEAQRQSFKSLRKKLIQYCRQPKMFMTEQSVLITHFFNIFVAEVRIIQEQVLNEAKRWPDEALLPLMQYAHEQKTLLEGQVTTLKKMASTTRSVKAQQIELKRTIEHLHLQLNEAEEIQLQLESSAPSQQATIQDIAIR